MFDIVENAIWIETSNIFICKYILSCRYEEWQHPIVERVKLSYVVHYSSQWMAKGGEFSVDLPLITLLWLVHLRAISQKMLRTLITDLCLKFTNLRLDTHLQGANELNNDRTEIKKKMTKLLL